jgi:predicted nucleic acid-binding protein
MADGLVVDAAAVADLLLGGSLGQIIAHTLDGHSLHAPAHIDLEVVATFDHLAQAGLLAESAIDDLVGQLAQAPIARHPIHTLLPGARARKEELTLAELLYLELATTLGLRLVTTDVRFRQLPLVELVRDLVSLSDG